MRIYSNKTYIAVTNMDTCLVMKGDKLRSMVAKSELADTDVVYEAQEFAHIQPTRTIQLVDASGAPVEDEAE